MRLAHSLFLKEVAHFKILFSYNFHLVFHLMLCVTLYVANRNLTASFSQSVQNSQTDFLEPKLCANQEGSSTLTSKLNFARKIV